MNSKSIAETELSSLGASPKEVTVLEKLKKISLLIKARPLSILRKAKHYHLSACEDSEIHLQEITNAESYGFVVPMDQTRKRKRDQNSVANGKEVVTNSYGQVRPFPVKWEWAFSWKDVSSPELLRALTNDKCSYSTIGTSLQKEISQHIFAELFIFFRTSAPAKYFEMISGHFLSQYPHMHDGEKGTGNVMIPLY